MDRSEFVPRREDSRGAGNDRDRDPRPIGEVLAELLARYERRFPGVQIAIVQTPAEAVYSC
jgi:hypothetical protein